MMKMRVSVQCQSDPFLDRENPALWVVNRQGAPIAGARVADCGDIVHPEPGKKSRTMSSHEEPGWASGSLKTNELRNIKVQGDCLSWQQEVCINREEAGHFVPRVNLRKIRVAYC